MNNDISNESSSIPLIVKKEYPKPLIEVILLENDIIASSKDPKDPNELPVY